MLLRQYLIKFNRRDSLVAYCSLDGRILQASPKLFHRAFGLPAQVHQLIGFPIQSLLAPSVDLHRVVAMKDTSMRSCLVRVQHNNTLLWITVEAVSLGPELLFCLNSVTTKQQVSPDNANWFTLNDVDMYDDSEDDESNEEDISDALIAMQVCSN